MSKNIPFVTSFGLKKKYNLVFKKPSLTNQSGKNEADINYLMRRFQRQGFIPGPVSPYRFGDFTSVQDYQTSLQLILDARDSFDSLPSTLRARFDNDPAKLLSFLEDPSNRAEAEKLGLVDQKLPNTDVKKNLPPDGGSHSHSEPNT